MIKEKRRKARKRKKILIAFLIILLLLAIFLTWLIPIFVFLMPACIVLIFDLILERIFRMYMSPEDLANEKEKDMLDKMD